VTVTHRAAVLGSPVGHSLSPVLHRAAYAALGLAGWEYDARECGEAALPALFAGLDDSWRGLSLTMPLKRAVMPLLDAVSPLAVAVGGVNTVTWEGGSGGARRAVGDNTDVHGLVTALGEAGIVGRVGSAVVLGGGATACSAIAALRELGCTEPVVQVRSAQRAGDLLAAAGRLGVRPVLAPLGDAAAAPAALAADVVVCTLPADGGATWAAGLRAAAVPGQKPAGVLLDVAYHPWPTAPAAAWGDLGGTAAGGFAMLLHQAAAQVRLMTGHEPPVEAMRSAGEAELSRRSHLG
jgi:shikimate dehydrogenase